MSTATNVVTTDLREEFQKALNAQTDRDKLAKCTIDLRDTGVDPCEGAAAVPRLFLITLSHHSKNYGVYINHRVTVGDILYKMIELGLLTMEEANTHHLVLKGTGQASLDLAQPLIHATDGAEFGLQLKPSSSLPTQTVIICTLTGKKLSLNGCSEMDTIAMIKARIYIQEGIQADQQRLIFRSKQLEDDRTLADYSIPNEGVINLVLRLRKPVIRLKSINNQVIKHVNLSIELDPKLWMLSSFYPEPSLTDEKTFIQWNNMTVDSDGKILFDKTSSTMERLYPLIDDENEHRMLFWEALTTSSSYHFGQEKNCCVPRTDFARVLNYLLKKMTLSVEDRDDLITYVLPQLDEADPEYRKEKITFRFLPSEIYSKAAQLTIRPLPQQIVRAFLLFGFGHDDEQISPFERIEKEIEKVRDVNNESQSGLIVHEWGSLFLDS